MALEGTIRDFGLPDIFQLIGLQRKTGLLTLTHEKGEVVTVVFENGMVVMADSSLRRLEDRLGNVLFKQGKISRERLDEALATQRQTLQRLGHVLSGAGAITSRDLRDALQVQVSQIVFRVFRWRDGRYQFAPSDTVDFDRENFAPMSTDFILMEGIRMVDEWPIIEKKISSLELVFKPVVDPGLIDVVGVAGDGSGAEKRGTVTATGRIRLSPEEERIFRKVDGTRTVQAIVDAAGVGEFDVCRTLFDFLNRNLIAPAGLGETRASDLERAETVAPVFPAYAVALLLVVIAFFAVLIHSGAPFAVTGLPDVLPRSQDLLRDSLMRDRLARLDCAITAWRTREGRLPATLEDLARAGLIDRSYLLDPWRRPFHYELGPTGYLLSAVDESGRGRADATLERRAQR
jgi:hypothetical protein